MINLLSLISLLQAGPAVSPDSSAGIEQDFSALLTEMGGNFNAEISSEIPDALSSVAAVYDRRPFPPDCDQAKCDQTGGHSPPLQWNPVEFGEYTAGAEVVDDQSQPAAIPDLLRSPPPASVLQLNEKVPVAALLLQRIRLAERAVDPVDPLPEPVLADLEQPEASKQDTDAILKDLKQIEVTVRHETIPEVEIKPRTERSSRTVVTADPIARVRESLTPLRVLPVQKVLVDEKPAERKNEPQTDANEVPQSAVPAFQPSDPVRAPETIDQPRPTQLIEVPNVPKLQVVRTVSMEVGDAGSEVIVRIEDRGGTMNLHFGTGSETMHRSLQSSIGALVEALKQQRIEISNVEVSRKEAIDKVRRMKEAH